MYIQYVRLISKQACWGPDDFISNSWWGLSATHRESLSPSQLLPVILSSNRSGTKARATSLSSLCPVMPTRERHLHGAWILMKQINPFLQHIFTLRLCFHCRPSAATLSNLKEVIKGVWSSLVVPWMFTLSSFSWMGAGWLWRAGKCGRFRKREPLPWEQQLTNYLNVPYCSLTGVLWLLSIKLMQKKYFH